ETAKQGVNPSTNHGRHTARNSGNYEALPRGENSRVVFARRWQRDRLFARRRKRSRSAGDYGNPAAGKGTVDGFAVHPRRAIDAAKGVAGHGSAALTL